MFVRYFTHVPAGLAVVQQRIEEVRSFLAEWAGVAYRDGEELRARVGPEPSRFAKEVDLIIGPPEVRKAGLVFPVRWSAAGAEALFPKLEASLILTHLGREMTSLSLEGTYQPPLGPLGRAVDRVALRKFAEATVKDWVDRVAEAVAVVPSSPDGQGHQDLGTRPRLARHG
jgi:hypothetical protein